LDFIAPKEVKIRGLSYVQLEIIVLKDHSNQQIVLVNIKIKLDRVLAKHAQQVINVRVLLCLYVE